MCWRMQWWSPLTCFCKWFIICAYKVKWTTLMFTYTCTYASRCIQCLCVRIYACMCTAAFKFFFQQLELHILVPSLCDPIALSSNKSQTKCCVTREETAISLECVVHVLEFLQHQSSPCSKGFTLSLVPSWSNFLHFPYFEPWVFAQAECLFFCPACVYICKVGVGRANAWSIRNWNGMSQGWLKAKMKYISLGSRGAWGSPVILDNLLFFTWLVPSIPQLTSFVGWWAGLCSAIRAPRIAPGVRAGEGACSEQRSCCVWGCPALSKWPVYLRRSQPTLGTRNPRARKGQSSWPPLSSVCWLKMVPTGFVVPAPLGIPEMSPHGTVLSVTCVPVRHWLGRVGVSDRQQLSECLSPPQDECPLGSGRNAFIACFGFCAKDNQWGIWLGSVFS